MFELLCEDLVLLFLFVRLAQYCGIQKPRTAVLEGSAAGGGRKPPGFMHAWCRLALKCSRLVSVRLKVNFVALTVSVPMPQAQWKKSSALLTADVM